ncbi:no pollen germination related 1 [Perilla frutescens var. hirtella]|uniref:No pollen germination related 1 n=1 Tax=Perilla frutescens var. hirtella TaxID=608512 RepID=A0AAD4P114_PERFH|nr:no pollen germination related 1 [Perilla frutescens var. hirtella]
MLCACSGEQFKLEEPIPQSPESLATRDFSASGISSRTGTGDWDSKLEDAQVDEAESTLKEALSLNYEEARALLGRLEYQRGNFDAALQVFQGIDIRLLSPRMSKAIAERTRPPRKSRSSRGRSVLTGVMSLHSVSLLLEAMLLKANSLAELGRVREAARECKIILDTVELALPHGIYGEIKEDGKLLEMFHRALELLPKLWLQAGSLDEAIAAYRRALLRPWNLDPQRLAKVQKDLASTLLYGGVEASIPSEFKPVGATFPESSNEESILLLFILMQKVLYGEIEWDPEIMDHLTFALTTSGHFESLADHVEQVLPGIYNRAERWYFLALCYSAAGQNRTALNLLKKVSGLSENNRKPHLASFLLGAKLCAQDPCESSEGINFSRRVIDVSLNQDAHMLGRAHKFLGICYGNAAIASMSDFERVALRRDSVNSLTHTLLTGTRDPEISFQLGLENAVQRNLTSAFEQAMLHSKMSAGSSARGWKLLALIASAEQRLLDAEAIVDLALDETGSVEQLELLRIKALVQIAQEQPKQAIETYRILLALIQGQGENHGNSIDEVEAERRLELEAWLDLAGLYSNHELWLDSDICLKKAKATKFYSARGWHETGRIFEAKEQYKEAIAAFAVSLSIVPDYVPSIVSTAGILLKMSNRSLHIAKSFLMNALRLEPTSHEAWLSLGHVYKMEGSMQQAADAFQAAHELKLSAPVLSFV